jgi:cleavage and polyadenylation specificity factor subunit 4
MATNASFDPAPIGNQVFAFEKINKFDKQIEEDLQSPGTSTDLCPLFFSKSGCKKGFWCQYRHARNDRLIVCKHWLRGLCKKAEYCEYLHEYDMSKMPECYFFSKFGQCSNTECLYRHIDPESRRNECPYYARGFCRHGAKCRYRHIKKVACPAYLRGFCKDGPNCKFGHAKFEIPRLGDEDSDPYGFGRPRGKGPVPFFNLDLHKWSSSGSGTDSNSNQAKTSQDHKRQPQPEEEENKKNSKPSGQIVCHLCGTPGHIKPRCPLRNMLQRK